MTTTPSELVTQWRAQAKRLHGYVNSPPKLGGSDKELQEYLLDKARRLEDYADELAAALAAAPQPASGEVVAEVVDDTIGYRTIQLHASQKDYPAVGTKLYAAPQPPSVADGCHCATCTCTDGMTKAVRYDASPAAHESVVRSKLIELGWTPPPGARGAGG